MIDFYLGMALFLLLTVVAGLIRILRGPTRADRMLATQLFGSTGVAILVLLSKSFQTPALLDIALVFALLAAIAAIAFVRRFWEPPAAVREDQHEY